MSIWVSHESIGYDDHFDDDATNHGEVRAFANGWSNHYPSADVEAEATLSLAHIPSWCVPGHRNDEDFKSVGPWIRLDVYSPGAVSWWHKTDDGRPVPEPINESIVLDEEAARLLVEQLTDWLARPKARPMTTPPTSVHPAAETTEV